MKFKPLWYDYHSEAVQMLSKEFPNKPTTKPLRIHISPEFLDEDEETHMEYEQEGEEEATEQHFPLMESTNQAMETSRNSSVNTSKSFKKSNQPSQQEGEASSKASRRRRKKRRRDSVEYDLVRYLPRLIVLLFDCKLLTFYLILEERGVGKVSTRRSIRGSNLITTS